MFERVLLPMDFSHHALKILECLGEIPGIKEVVILHVIDPGRIAHGGETETTLRKKARLELEEQKKRLTGLEVEISIRVGIPSKEIIRTAEEMGASLIVMGARGNSLIRDILLGSVTSDVVRYSRCNVLVMRYRVVEQLKGEEFEKYCGRIFYKILCPTDFSANAERAVSAVKKIAGELVLMHVMEKGDMQQELDAAVDEAKRRLMEAGYASPHVHIGDAASEINRVAEEEDVSLIAVGSRGKGVIEELRTGSTAEALVRSARRPVLILRT